MPQRKLGDGSHYVAAPVQHGPGAASRPDGSVATDLLEVDSEFDVGERAKHQFMQTVQWAYRLWHATFGVD